MDDFVNILQRDYGLKPQGKSAPMTAAKTADPLSSSASIYHTTSTGTSRNGSSRGSRILTSMPAETQQDDMFFASNGPTRNASVSVGDDLLGGSGGVLYDDVFAEPPKFTPPVHPSCPSATTYTSGFDDLFGLPVKQQSCGSNKSSSLPVFDAPFYEEDIFGGVRGIKSTSVAYDDVFGGGGGSRGGTSPDVLEDLLGGFGVSESRAKTSSDHHTAFAPHIRSSQAGDAETDELLPGFGGVEPRARAGVKSPQAKSFSAENNYTAMFTQQRVDAKDSDYTSSNVAFDSIDTASIKSSASSTGRKDPSSAFDEEAISDNNLPSNSAAQLSNQKVVNLSRQAELDGMTTNPGSAIKACMDGDHFGLHQQNVNPVKDPCNSSSSSPKSQFTRDTEDGSTGSPSRRGQMAHDKVNDSSQLSKSMQSRRFDEIWISVDEVKLVTQPTSAPPPSRPPPVPASKRGYGSRKQSMLRAESKKALASEFYESTFANNTSPLHDYEDISSGPKEASAAESDITMGVDATSASSAAMKEAMERAKAKAEEKEWEVRATRVREEREKARQAREREEEGKAYMQEKDKEAEREAREREEREREAREKRQKEREKERGREREKDRIAVERAAQEARERAERAAVERATAEARERAAAEARERAAAEARERAAAEARERAAAEARERAAAERAAVERAAAEARERAAAEAKERAAVERATMEARERAAAEARERAERAAVERAASEARARAERAAVDRALTEARERAAEKAAAEARERAERVAVEKAAATAREQQQRRNENDLEAFFSSTSRAGSAPRQRSPNTDVSSKGASNEGSWKGPASTSSGVKRVPSASTISDDWTSIFGPAPASGEFREVEGESAERRRARLERHQRTLERTVKALEEKNQRDLQAKRDQEERQRVGDALDAEIKRWAAGKEGNLRALLSTLQYVLWPECGWQPISLTDLITAAAVKKVYRKATLCVHPDKVQQKGATVQQKYIAEKVFDLLKEAWNKFNSEELF